MDEYISAAEAGRRLGLSRSRAATLARNAYKQREGEWPQKKGRGYLAPLSYWEELFEQYSLKVRKRRKEKQPPKIQDEIKLITASQAAEKLNISPSWVAQLAKRSHLLKRQWPKKVGRMWLAPMSEWEKIVNSLDFKSWKRK